MQVWCDGRLVAAGDPLVAGLDSAFTQGIGCYTTMLCEGGQAAWAERHAQRLVEGVRGVGLGELPVARARWAVGESAAACWPSETGALRLQCSSWPDGSLHFVAIPRGLGDDPQEWRAISASATHWGPMPWGGTKLISHWPAILGRREAQAAGVEEALLFDAEERLIEGARSNLVVALEGRDGRRRLATPDMKRGGVAGMARDTLLDAARAGDAPAIDVCDITRDALLGARAAVVVNSLRYGRALVELDGRALGDPVESRSLAKELEVAIRRAPDHPIEGESLGAGGEGSARGAR